MTASDRELPLEKAPALQFDSFTFVAWREFRLRLELAQEVVTWRGAPLGDDDLFDTGQVAN